MYRIREVDTEDYADELHALHKTCFDDGTSVSEFDEGHWWIAFFRGLSGRLAIPAAFIGVRQSIVAPDVAYFIRVGVVPEHRGNALQRRLMRVMEQKAKRVGWSRIVTDTRKNPHSANNIIAAGYRMFEPEDPWSFSDACYWTKDLT